MRHERFDSREAWLEARRQGVGASEVAAILGVDPRRGPLAVYAAKVAGEADEDSIEMEMGRRFEAPLADWYAEQTGRRVEDPGTWSITRGGRTAPLCATLDRLIAPSDDRPPGVLECKLIWPSKASAWKREPPPEVQVQLQAQLAVTGYSWGSVAVLVGGMRPYYFDLPRNDAFIELMVERIEGFWGQVTNRVTPDPDAFPETAAALARLFPGKQPEHSVALSHDDLEMVETLEKIRGQLDTLAVRERLAANSLKLRLGDATTGYLPDGRRLRWYRIRKGGALRVLERMKGWRPRRSA